MVLLHLGIKCNLSLFNNNKMYFTKLYLLNILMVKYIVTKFVYNACIKCKINESECLLTMRQI